MEIKPNLKVKNGNTFNPRIVLPDQTAFPSTELMTFGLSKREYFAAMAMLGLLSKGQYKQALSWRVNDYTNNAVEIADELIESLNK
jgi:uncharacterized protein YjfI (DUF2170 family)